MLFYLLCLLLYSTVVNVVLFSALEINLNFELAS